MFGGLSNLIEVDLTNFDFSQVERMNSMFQNCYNLEYIKFHNNIKKNIMANDMSFMFENCRSLKTLDLSNLDTYDLRSTTRTFLNCCSLTSINFNPLNTLKLP